LRGAELGAEGGPIGQDVGALADHCIGATFDCCVGMNGLALPVARARRAARNAELCEDAAILPSVADSCVNNLAQFGGL
jgi:hypothetical protein